MEPSSCQSSQCESIASNLRARIATTENEADYWRAMAERLRETLEWLNSRGGLGHDVHERIRATLSSGERGS